MEQELLSLLANGAPNVAFAMFLLWQYKEQQKRSDDREKRYEAQMIDVRARYDKVISDMQDKEDVMRQTLVKEINDLDKKVSLLEQKLDIISKVVDEIKASFTRIV